MKKYFTQNFDAMPTISQTQRCYSVILWFCMYLCGILTFGMDVCLAIACHIYTFLDVGTHTYTRAYITTNGKNVHDSSV